MTLNEMVKMGLNREKQTGDLGVGGATLIRRVPGGWIYTEVGKNSYSSVFGPLPVCVESVKGVDF